MQSWRRRERAAEVMVGRPISTPLTMDYHDLKMFELEQVAEERLNDALAALDRGEVAARREVQRWAITLENIRQMKTAVTRMAVGRLST